MNERIAKLNRVKNGNTRKYIQRSSDEELKNKKLGNIKELKYQKIQGNIIHMTKVKNIEGLRNREMKVRKLKRQEKMRK